jgi:hypothetical protein
MYERASGEEPNRNYLVNVHVASGDITITRATR